jgi:hypothetical protein
LIRVGVVHHPSRADLLSSFDGLDPIVYEDPEPDGVPSPWRTYRYALANFPDGASHLVLMQDDAQPVEGFLEAVDRAVAARPDDPIVLFVSRQATRSTRLLFQACADDESFFTLHPQEWVPVVAVVWPRTAAAEFLEWALKRFPADRRRADDAIVGDWARSTGTRVVGTVPSLVEHPDEVDSLIGLKHRIPRRAACLAGHGDDFQPQQTA